jgi:hypothetical protein
MPNVPGASGGQGSVDKFREVWLDSKCSSQHGFHMCLALLHAVETAHVTLWTIVVQPCTCWCCIPGGHLHGQQVAAILSAQPASRQPPVSASYLVPCQLNTPALIQLGLYYLLQAIWWM